MILEKLKNWQYYEDLLPMMIKDSHGTPYHFKMLVDLLLVLDEITDKLFNQLNITETVSGFGFDITEATDILDKIGALLGLSRYVHVKDLTISHAFDEDIELNNEDFLKFIKAKIALNSYDGTRENANNIYNTLSLPFYMLNSDTPAEVHFYVDTSTTGINNLAKIVLSGLATLESMGITYVYSALDISKLGYWDSAKWDNGIWGI